MLVQFESLYKVVCDVYLSNGADSHEAKAIADEVLYAEATGRHTHGLSMVPKLLKRLSDTSGIGIDTEKETPTWALLRGNGRPGPIVARAAMDLAVKKAGDYGLSLVGVVSPSPFLTAGYNVMRVARDEDMIALDTSVAKAKVAPYGSTTPILGTNPIGFGFPADPHPVVLDMAVTKIPAADVRAAAKEGKDLPEGVAVSAEGKPTVDASAALEGALLTFGGYKGSGLGVLVELLCGAFLGSKCGLRAGNMRAMLFLVIKADLFGSLDNVKQLASQFREDVWHSSRSGDAKPSLPGDRSFEAYEKARVSGLSVDEAVLQGLRELIVT